MLLILGTCPPPIGGVTIHTLRLINALEASGLEYLYIDLRKRKILVWFNYLRILLLLIRYKSRLILHYQLNNWYEGALLSMFSKIFHAGFIYTVHSFPIPIERVGRTENFLIKFCMRNSNLFIAPSPEILKKLTAVGFPVGKLIVLNTFLPPSAEELEQELPKELEDYFQGDTPVILCNAYKLYLNHDGIDLYGLDMCIDASIRLNGFKFLFCTPLFDPNYLSICERRIEESRLQSRFKIYTQNISLVSVMKYSSIFVRPTASDSYGISVAEAISLGIPTVASDVCRRSSGTILFKSRNVDDFVEKIRIAYINPTNSGNLESCFPELLSIYSNLGTVNYSSQS